MVALGGLGYEFAAWEADGSIQVASGWYLEAPGRHGSSPGGPQILRPLPGEGLGCSPGARKLTIYMITIFESTRLLTLPTASLLQDLRL